MIAHTKARPKSDNGWKRSRLALPNTNNPNKGRHFFLFATNEGLWFVENWVLFTTMYE